jgi:hypothetical protein
MPSGPGKRRATLKKVLPRGARRHLLRASDWGYRSREAVAGLRSGSDLTPPEDTRLEGVVVLGMHRSGTSLVTRLVSLSGLGLCREDDLLVGDKSNPRGHWESISLLAFNRRLLEELGGTWFCPPTLDPERLSRMLERHASDALARLRTHHPELPWVWKDPRTCLLMPFWSAVLGERAAYVLVTRHPLEVSDSLARRSGCTRPFGLALWERYTRQAMLGAAGRPTMVCTYDEVLADPIGWGERLLAFLGELGAAGLSVDRAAGTFAVAGLRRSRESWTRLQADPAMSSAQAALAAAASLPVTARAYAPPALPPETPATEAMFEEIRRELARQPSGERRLRRLPEHLVTPRGRRGGAGRASRPPVSVVLAQGETDARASIAVLAEELPAGSELLIAGDAQDAASDLDRHDVTVRTIDCERSGGSESFAPGVGAQASALDTQVPVTEGLAPTVAALALGAAAARGSIVVLLGARLLRCEPWYQPISRALGAPAVGGVGPVVCFSCDPEERWFGQSLMADDLALHPLTSAQAEPASATLLLAAFAAFDRRVLMAAGGVDTGFIGADAAVAELSIRIWRMGFQCQTSAQIEASSDGLPAAEPRDRAALLHDRMRIAMLHLDSQRLRAFTERASGLPAYDSAAERLASSDVEHKRGVICAACAFPLDHYLERPGSGAPDRRPNRTRGERVDASAR